MNFLARLEAARGFLESERFRRAAGSLPGPGSLPAALRPERDFIEAECLRAQGFFKRAERLYRRVLARAGAETDPVLWLEAALGSAAGLRSLGAVSRGRKLLVRAWALTRKRRLGVFLRRFEIEDALLDRAAGSYAASIRKLKGLLARSSKERALDEAAFLYWALGGALRFHGELAASEAAFRRSLALSRRTEDRVAAGYALFGLGGVARIRGFLGDSARFYAEAGKAFEGTEDIFGRAYAQCGLANALRQQGRLDEAQRHYRKSYALYSRLEDEVDLAYVDWGLGKIHLHRGELGAAERWLRLSARRFAAHGEARGLVLAKQALAQTLHALGRTGEAERLFSGAWQLSRRSGLHAHLEVFT